MTVRRTRILWGRTACLPGRPGRCVLREDLNLAGSALGVQEGGTSTCGTLPRQHRFCASLAVLRNFAWRLGFPLPAMCSAAR